MKKVVIGIYDERGRLVRTLYKDSREPGKYLLEWDGTSDRGVRVAAGTYYLEITIEGGTTARFKVVLTDAD